MTIACFADAASELPRWLTSVNIVLTLTFSGAMVYFAKAQNRLSETQLRITSFDRRLAVYNAMQQFIANVANPADSLPMLKEQTWDAHFLFKRGDSIIDYINHFRTQASDLVGTRMVYNTLHGQAQEAERVRLIEKENSLQLWFVEQDQILTERFHDYLQLENS
jgi:citrate synthase